MPSRGKHNSISQPRHNSACTGACHQPASIKSSRFTLFPPQTTLTPFDIFVRRRSTANAGSSNQTREQDAEQLAVFVLFFKKKKKIGGINKIQVIFLFREKNGINLHSAGNSREFFKADCLAPLNLSMIDSFGRQVTGPATHSLLM